MRKNLPVTQRQRDLPEGISLVSKTDLDGVITYANQAFVDVSGFRREELIGAPHNIVRHPDMPSEVFADLWATLRRGSTWSGVVKNRSKDGDHYWVMANITPVREGGRVVGYMSVRITATAAQIAAAEQLYAAMRSGQFRGRRLEGGLVRYTNPLRRLLSAQHWGVAARVHVVTGINVGAVLFTGGAFAAGAPPALLWAATIGVAGLCALTGTILARSIASPLNIALDTACGIATGEIDFRTANRSANEIGRVLRVLQQIAVNFAAIVKDIQSGTASIHRATAELSEETFGLSQRTEEQAGNLTQTAASLAALADTVRRNADNLQRARDLSFEAALIAEDGGHAVRNVVSNMSAITERSKRIADVVSLIDDIAFQTNLLALNAAVEAAHAGQQGKGFAVVAAEVRNLAQRSAEAAKEIKALITGSVRQVESGQELVERAGETIERVVASVTRVRDLTAEIAADMQGQSTDIEQVNQALRQLEHITQQNVALVEETAAATETMQQDAARLNAAVAVFQVCGGPPPRLAARGSGLQRGAPGAPSKPVKAAVGRRAA